VALREYPAGSFHRTVIMSAHRRRASDRLSWYMLCLSANPKKAYMTDTQVYVSNKTNEPSGLEGP